MINTVNITKPDVIIPLQRRKKAFLKLQLIFQFLTRIIEGVSDLPWFSAGFSLNSSRDFAIVHCD